MVVNATGLDMMLSVREHLDNLPAGTVVHLAPEIVPGTVACLGLLLRPVPTDTRFSA